MRLWLWTILAALAAPLAYAQDPESEPAPDDAIVAEIRKLRDADAALRTEAARALGALGKKARGALPALDEALRDQDPDVRRAAAWAIERIRGPDADKNPKQSRREWGGVDIKRVCERHQKPQEHTKQTYPDHSYHRVIWLRFVGGGSSANCEVGSRQSASAPPRR